MALTKEKMGEYDKIRNSTIGRMAYLKLLSQSPNAKKRAKGYYKENKAKIQAYRKTEGYKQKEAIWESNPKRVAQKKAYRESEHGKRISRNSRLKKVFGITIEDYDALLSTQNGVCAICKAVQNNGIRLAVDHSHKTKKVRGLLCMECNRAVGLLKDNSKIAQQVVNYLKYYGF